MGKDDKTIIVSMSHWDREWYQPFNIMRFRLVAMVDSLIDLLESDVNFHSFMMDGQTSIIEDYLQIRGGSRGRRLVKLIKDHRIIIGPYYVQCSAWLQTGEGYIRNLLLGHLDAEAYGIEPMKVGYIPDQFVHFEQMPQVFSGFNIGAAIFGRGMGNQQEEHNLGFEFSWKAPDGAEVMGVHISNGYGQCTRLPSNPDDALNGLLLAKGSVNRYKRNTHWALMFSGDDHSPAQPVLPDAIALWNDIEEIVEDEGTVQHGTLEEYIRNVKAESPRLSPFTGEIRGHRYQVSFQGVFSSFMPLKKRNFHAHDVLERYAEPLSIISRVLTSHDYSGYLETAWKWFMKNQPHDSSWTASWSPVMEEMGTRFNWAIQNAEEVRNWALLDIYSNIIIDKQTKQQVEIVCFNPLEFPRKESIQLVIPTNFPLEDGFRLTDSSGKILRAYFKKRVVRNEELITVRKFVASQGSRPRFFYDLFIEPVDVPAIGYTTLVINPRLGEGGDGSAGEIPEEVVVEHVQEQGTLKSTGIRSENEVLILEINQNGTLKIVDKISGETYDNLNYFEDMSDVGDGYEWIPIIGDTPISSKHAKAKIEKIVDEPYLVRFRVVVDFEVPAGANEQFNWRLDDLISIPVTSIVTMYSGKNPRVDVKVSFENKARDHRMSVVFPTPLRARDVDVDGHFGLTQRRIKLPDAGEWKVKPVPQAPQHRFINVTDYSGEKGLIIANRGLAEYEAILQDDDTINLGLTLMRGFCRWGVHINKKSPVIIEKAQLLGKHEYEYSIIPHQGDIFKKGYAEAMSFRYPVHAEYRGEYNKYQGYFPSVKKPEPFLPMSQSFFKLDPLPLVLSSIKKAERSDDIIVRFFNASKTDVIAGTLETSIKIKEVQLVDLNEMDIDGTNMKIEADVNAITMTVPPARIVTMKIKTS
ncbi:MAG: glycosyl hydrolase-related protein [Promethearchaeota archaeon]